MGSHNPAAQLAFMDGINHFIPSPAPGQQFFAGGPGAWGKEAAKSQIL
jgi:hypothetical protein